MEDYTAEIMKILNREGFDELTKPKADDVIESLKGILSDLAVCNWDYEVFTKVLKGEL